MSKEKPLKKVINDLLRVYGYQDQLDELALIEAYKDNAGQLFSNHTKKIYFKDKKLFVYLDSAALKQELSYAKETIVIKLNQTIGRDIVEDIIIK